MRLSRPALVVLALFSIPAIAAAQQPPPASTPQRDPQAVAVLQRALDASGGTQTIGGIKDFLAAGNITLYGNPDNGGVVTIRWGASQQFRFDAVTSLGTRSLIASRGRGLFVSEGGRSRHLSNLETMTLTSMMLPLPMVAITIKDPTTDMIHKGLISDANGPVYQIHTGPTGFPEFIREFKSVEYFIDSSSMLIRKTKWTSALDGRGARKVGCEIEYGDYRTVSGAMIPFRIVLSIAGQPAWRIDLSTVQLNVGFKEADFQF